MMLERAADYLEREFDSFTTTALALLEPAIIILMGAMVALIVLSILLPILQLDTLAGGIDVQKSRRRNPSPPLRREGTTPQARRTGPAGPSTGSQASPRGGREASPWSS